MFVSCDKMELCSADEGFCIIKRSKFSRSCEIDKVSLKKVIVSQSNVNRPQI